MPNPDLTPPTKPQHSLGDIGVFLEEHFEYIKFHGDLEKDYSPGEADDIAAIADKLYEEIAEQHAIADGDE